VPPQLSHLLLVFGSVPVPEQTGHVLKLSRHVVNLGFIAFSPFDVSRAAEPHRCYGVSVAGHQTVVGHDEGDNSMTDRIKVRFAREHDSDAVEAFARRRVAWLRERSVPVEWSGIIPVQARKIVSDVPGADWRVFIAVENGDDRPVGRVVAWVEPPTDPANGDRTPRAGTLGLTGLCTDPDAPGAARVLADWAARHAGSMGLADVRLPTTDARLASHYPKLGFTLQSESTNAKGKTVWEFFRSAE
jgi:hypothetical protein